MTTNNKDSYVFSRINLPKLHPKDQLYIGNIELIKKNGPYSYYMTITFPKHLTDPKRIILFNKFIIRLSKKIYGSHGFQKGLFLEGLTFLEKNRSGGLHMHTLFKENPYLFETGHPTFGTHVREVHQKMFTRFKGSTKSLDIQPIHLEDDINNNEICHPDNDRDVLAKYCIKDTKYSQTLKVGKRDMEVIQPLGKFGIESQKE